MSIGTTIYYHFGNFQFSESRGLVWNGASVQMQPRAQALLFRLLEADGDFVGKADLQSVVSSHSSASAASLSRTMYLLRAALNDDEGKIIQTAYNRGSRIALPITRSVKPLFTDKAVAQLQSLAPSLPNIMHVSSGEEMIRTAFELAAQRTDRQLKFASAVLDHALERFPTLALAPSLQADIEISRMIRGYTQPASMAGDVNDMVDKALAIQPRLPSALATKGWLASVIGNDADHGLKLIDIALATAPHLWLASFYKAWLLIGERRLDIAQSTLDYALRISPLERGLLALKGWLLHASGQSGDAVQFIDEALGLRPDVELLWIVKSMIHAHHSDHDQAHEAMGRALNLYPDDTFVQANHAWLQAATGNQSAAVKFLSQIDKPTTSYVSPIHIAMIHRALGDDAGVINAVKSAEADQDPWRLLAWCDPRIIG